MTCTCGSTSIMTVSMKHSDACSIYIPEMNVEYEGYMLPLNDALQGGDYTHLKVCTDCGQIQHWQPLKKENVEAVVKGNF
jgi:hypothetical protein